MGIVKVWNETVANLSLMALGSSAPEILLSVIEIWAKGFKSGDLGPGTIVGSAAFNLFMIIGLCMYVIPDDEVRKIKHLRVFLVTATWSVFAYIWLYVILDSSPTARSRAGRVCSLSSSSPSPCGPPTWLSAACSATSGSAKPKRRALLLLAARLTSRLVVPRSSRTLTRMLTPLWPSLRGTVVSTSAP